VEAEEGHQAPLPLGVTRSDGVCAPCNAPIMVRKNPDIATITERRPVSAHTASEATSIKVPATIKGI
jgi:hypothetical protein